MIFMDPDRHSKAPFIYDAWTSPKVGAAVSKVAGVDVVPVSDIEIGHTNVSSSNLEDVDTNTRGKSAFPWHYDSFTFACVTMISDFTDMVGVETETLAGDGKLIRVRGPEMVGAILR
jgi:hypothetical protein